MENWTDFSSKSLIDKILLHLTGSTYKNSTVIKVNSENLALNGELYFLNSLNAWKSHVACDKDCKSIVQHYAHIHGTRREDTDARMVEEILDQLISENSDWSLRIQRCTLRRERVCLFLNRMDIIPNAIKTAVLCGVSFGRTSASDKVFDLRYQSDTQSDLTTQRLRLTRDVVTKVLYLHGYRVSEENCINKYVFTTKSEGSIEGRNEGYEKYVCGVVKNSRSNAKETCLTWKQCIKQRMKQLESLNQHISLKSEGDDSAGEDFEERFFLRDMASAIVTFDLMTVKPSRSIVIGNNNIDSDGNVTNTKGALFILYNTARIATIIAKYKEMVSRGDYLSLPNIEDVDFSQLHEEEEWEIIYNFIFGYPQMLRNCLRFEPSFRVYPQMICMFLSRLCQKFSVYYRRVRILTKGSDHLAPKMFARLYMLHALQVVLKNALDILDIKPVLQM